jgi:5-methylthioribose kinase
MGFDLGMVTANFLMAYLCQPAHRGDDLEDYQQWVLSVIGDSLQTFRTKFKRLWHSDRTGMLYPTTLFEDQGQDSSMACEQLLADINTDAMAFYGIEMHRRCLSLAHNADFEDIEDPTIREPLEARNLEMGTQLILEADTVCDDALLISMAKSYNQRNIL